jgi:hypothetical protein
VLRGGPLHHGALQFGRRPAVDAIVGTAGSGTVVATLTAGLPAVLRPVLADQPRNAQRARALLSRIPSRRARPCATCSPIPRTVPLPGPRPT